MKSLCTALALAISFPALAAIQPEGTFASAHPIYFFSYADKAACEADEGTWEAHEQDSGFCFFNTEDTLTVKTAKDGYAVEIETVRTNAHTCSFEGAAKRVSENVLEASAESEMWVPGQGQEEGKFVPATCRVSLTYTNADTVDVRVVGAPQACESFCGANASLEMEGAKRR